MNSLVTKKNAILLPFIIGFNEIKVLPNSKNKFLIVVIPKKFFESGDFNLVLICENFTKIEKQKEIFEIPSELLQRSQTILQTDLDYY